MLRIGNFFSIFGNVASALEIVGTILSFLVIGSGGFLAFITAKDAPLLEPFGALGWVAAGVIVACIVAVVLLIMSMTNAQSAKARYFELMSLREGQFNPGSTHFMGRVIPINDLHMPEVSLHEDKLIENCTFAGPGGVAILGGKIEGCDFNMCGTMVVIPAGASITGIPVLRDCTIKGSKFVRVTLFCDEATGQAFKAGGAQVVGLSGG